MKTRCYLLTVLALGAFAFTTQAADKVPALPINGALKIAQDYLHGKGGALTIVALTLENATLRGETYWFAKWSAPIAGDKPELGLRIDMNGEITKVVGGGAAAAVPGPGQQRQGARNIR